MRTGAPENPDAPGGVSPLVLGAGLGLAGAYALWRGLSMRPAPGDDPKAVRRSRLRWCAVGLVALGGGVLLIRKAVRE